MYSRKARWTVGLNNRMQKLLTCWICPILAHLSLQAHKVSLKYTHGPASVVRRRPFTFSNFFSSETAWPIKAKFHVEPPWEGGTKVYINDPGHMTKMAAMLKTLKNLLLKNHWANCLETWHVASGYVVLQS